MELSVFHSQNDLFHLQPKGDSKVPAAAAALCQKILMIGEVLMFASKACRSRSAAEEAERMCGPGLKRPKEKL